jgi:hypothetical protein
VEVAVLQTGTDDMPKLNIRTRGSRLGVRAQAVLVALSERMLELRADLTEFHRFNSTATRVGLLEKHSRNCPEQLTRWGPFSGSMGTIFDTS